MAGQGRAGFSFFQLPTGSVINEDISEQTKLDADKLEHIHKPFSDFGLNTDDTPAGTVEKAVFVAGTAGKIRGFHATLIAGGSNTAVDFDLHVNGASVLSAPISYSDADGNSTVKAGTVANTALAINDLVSMVMDVNTATNAAGPLAWVDIEEQAP